MRGNPRTLDWRKPSEELGYEVITMDRYPRDGSPMTPMALIDERIGDAPLYVTFDLDCLDPTVAPAVANLEAGCEGFGIDEVMRLLRCVRGKDVIGGDVVCLMPTKDHTQPDHGAYRGGDHVRDRQPGRGRLSGIVAGRATAPGRLETGRLWSMRSTPWSGDGVVALGIGQPPQLGIPP